MGQPLFSVDTIDPAINPLVAQLARAFSAIEPLEGAGAVDGHEMQMSRLLAFAAEAEQQLQWARRRITTLETICETDELTGLLNRRGLRRQMERTLAHAKRYGEFGTVLFIDIDDLAGINEAYGEPVGDAVLRYVARVLERQTRVSDLLARFGGDEFVLVMERCNQRNALARAEAFQSYLDAHPLRLRDVTIPIAVRYGFAPMGGAGSPDQVLGARLTPEPVNH